MNDNPPTNEHPGRSRRFWWVLLSFILPGFLVAVWLLLTAANRTVPKIPDINLRDANNRVAHAIEAASRVVRLKPKSASAWGRLGMTLHAHEYVDPAMTCYRVAADLDADDFRWPGYIAILFSSFDRTAAMEQFDRALQLNPGSPDLLMRRAQLLIDSGRPGDARRELELVLAGEPGNAQACFLLSQILLEADEAEQSLTWALAAAELVPDHRGVRELLARIHSRLGHRAEAVRQLELARRLPTSYGWPDLLLDRIDSLRRDSRRTALRAQQLIRHGDLAGGIRLLQSALTFDTDDQEGTWLHADLAEAWLQANDPENAMKVLNRAIETWPDSFELIRLRGVVFMTRQQWFDAERAFSRACEIIDDNAAVHFNRGLCLIKLERLNDGLSSFEQAVRFDPNFADARVELARQLIRIDRFNRAKEQLTIAMQLNAKHEEARELLQLLSAEP